MKYESKMESLAQSSCRAVSIYSSFTLFKASGEAQKRLINQIISLFNSQSKKFQKTNQSYYFNFITYLNFFEPFLIISYKIIIQNSENKRKPHSLQTTLFQFFQPYSTFFFVNACNLSSSLLFSSLKRFSRVSIVISIVFTLCTKL